MRDALLLLVGAAVGAIGTWLVQRRIEATLRTMLNVREADITIERERVETLLGQLTQTSRAGHVRQAPDVEAVALVRAETQQRKRISDDQFLKRAVNDIRKQRPDVTDTAALKEAQRLLEETRMEQPPA